MFPNYYDKVIITALAAISDKGNHPVSSMELWEEIRSMGLSLTQPHVEETVRKLFALNLLVYAFDRKLRLIHLTDEDYEMLKPRIDNASHAPHTLFGKPVEYRDFFERIVEGSNYSDGNDSDEQFTISGVTNFAPPFTVRAMRREDYSIPHRIQLKVTHDGTAFHTTAANPEDEYWLDQAIQGMKNEEDGDSGEA